MIRRLIGFWILGAVVLTGIYAYAEGEGKKETSKPAAKAAGAKTPGAPPVAAKVVSAPATGAKYETSKRRLVTFRGEIVDYYCYIEKGLTGPAHRECGVRCVAGDVCMGLLTTDGDLYMISVNHLRAMDPLSFKGIPDPFNTCRGWIAETVDLTGYAMERKGQRILEIMGVKKGEGPLPAKSP